MKMEVERPIVSLDVFSLVIYGEVALIVEKKRPLEVGGKLENGPCFYVLAYA